MKDTGERHIINPEYKSAVDYYGHLVHIASYNFALQNSENKIILDYGCGSGYGSKILSQKAKLVIAVDISSEAIEFAKNNYAADNIIYLNIEDFKNQYPNQLFDCVTSFQVIEHVEDTHEYLSILQKKLKPEGNLFIATPDKSYRLYNFIQKPWNIYHLKEYNTSEYLKLLIKYFNHVKILKMTSVPEFVIHEIKRGKKQRLITLPFTLFFYPNRMRIYLLLFLEKLHFFIAQKIKKPNKNKVLQTLTEKPFLKFGIDNIEISEDPQNPTILLAICKNSL